MKRPETTPAVRCKMTPPKPGNAHGCTLCERTYGSSKLKQAEGRPPIRRTPLNHLDTDCAQLTPQILDVLESRLDQSMNPTPTTERRYPPIPENHGSAYGVTARPVFATQPGVDR